LFLRVPRLRQPRHYRCVSLAAGDAVRRRAANSVLAVLL